MCIHAIWMSLKSNELQLEVISSMISRGRSKRSFNLKKSYVNYASRTCNQWLQLRHHRLPLADRSIYEIQKLSIRVAHIQISSFASINYRTTANSEERVESSFFSEVYGFFETANKFACQWKHQLPLRKNHLLRLLGIKYRCAQMIANKWSQTTNERTLCVTDWQLWFLNFFTFSCDIAAKVR